MDLTDGFFDIFNVCDMDWADAVDVADECSVMTTMGMGEESGSLTLAASDERDGDPFDKLPDEMLQHVFSFLSTTNLFVVADVCKRFRYVACQEMKHFDMDMLPGSKKEETSGPIICRLVKLKSLDLTATSCRLFLSTNAQITAFASSLATNCRKIERFTLTGQRGARILRVYVNLLGEEVRVKHVSLDIQRAAIGCAASLKHVCGQVSLNSLMLSSSQSIRRSSRTREVLSQLFAHLLPGIPILSIRFTDDDADLEMLAASLTSGVRHFIAGRLTDDGILAALAERNPDLQSLQMIATSHALKQLHLFKKLEKLWIHVQVNEDIESEDVEEALAAESLRSHLRFLCVKGSLGDDPLLALCQLAHLETLVVDNHDQLFCSNWTQNWKRMARLKNLIFRTNCEDHIPATASSAGTVVGTADILMQFPRLQTIQFMDFEFSRKENFTVRRPSSMDKVDKSLFPF